MDILFGIGVGVSVSLLIYLGVEIKMIARDIHLIAKFIENPPPIELRTSGHHQPEPAQPYEGNYK